MQWRVDYEYQFMGATFFGSMVCQAYKAEAAKHMIGNLIYKAKPGISELYMRASEASPLDFAELGLTNAAGPGRTD